jgi:hypothetical protein
MKPFAEGMLRQIGGQENRSLDSQGGNQELRIVFRQ